LQKGENTDEKLNQQKTSTWERRQQRKKKWFGGGAYRKGKGGRFTHGQETNKNTEEGLLEGWRKDAWQKRRNLARGGERPSKERGVSWTQVKDLQTNT